MGLRNKVFALGLLAFALLWGIANMANAQQTFGSIYGTITDPSGSAVANATVTITDVSKGFNYTAQTDNGGIFTVKNLPPATYKERVEAPGFTPFERNNIVLEVNGNVEASANLELVSTG